MTDKNTPPAATVAVTQTKTPSKDKPIFTYWVLWLTVGCLMFFIYQIYGPQSAKDIQLSVNSGNAVKKIQVQESEHGFIFHIHAREGKKRIAINFNQVDGESFKQDPKTTEAKNLNMAFKTQANNQTLTINLNENWYISEASLDSFGLDESYVSYTFTKKGFWPEYAHIIVYLTKPEKQFGAYFPRQMLEDGYKVKTMLGNNAYTFVITTPAGKSVVNLINAPSKGHEFMYNAIAQTFRPSLKLINGDKNAVNIPIKHYKHFRLLRVLTAQHQYPNHVYFEFKDGDGNILYLFVDNSKPSISHKIKITP